MTQEKRLIDFELAKRATYEEVFWTESEQAAVRHFLAKLPKVAAVEVVDGRWEYWAGGLVRCSACGHEYTDYLECKNYCGNCGTKMAGGDDNG